MTGILILAAGESSRFGACKQLAEFQGNSLLRHVTETAVAAGLGPVNVVLGAVDQPCRKVLEKMDVTVVHNPGWRQGMASSIIAGISLWKETPLNGLIVLLADQPAVTPQHLRDLEAASPSHSIVASLYDGQLGVPAWFSPDRFPDLLTLKGGKGAKSLISREPDLHWIEVPEAAFDVDTPEDLVRLSRQHAGEAQWGQMVPVRERNFHASEAGTFP